MVFLKKRRQSVRWRLFWFFVEIGAVALLLVLMSICFYLVSRGDYEKSTEQMLTLNEFYSNLENINQNVYTYTLDGDEAVYQEIESACMESRGVLGTLSGMEVSIRFYRDIRDVEQMFLNYTKDINRIYDHSYLCEQMTIGSKQIINKYYDETQEDYELIRSEFQNLYSQLLDYVDREKGLLRRKYSVYLVDLLVIVVVVAVDLVRKIREISNQVLRPVQALTENARQISQGELDMNQRVICETTADDELRMLIDVYNSMIQRIQAQIRTIQENNHAKERLKDKEMENLRMSNLLKTSKLKALQMQINPHFLFNTLNMISQTAYTENGEQTMYLLGKTANLLRYTLDYTDKAVSLSREIEMLGNYVELQECRFGDRIRFSFDLDERFHNIQIPSMILQPLMENALTHGVGMRLTGARVVFRTSYLEKEERGIIEVIDNGNGMSEEKLQEVCREMRESDLAEQKIGLCNVYLRLQLFFNRQARMEIYSKQGRGTRVWISLPCPLEELRKGEEPCAE